MADCRVNQVGEQVDAALRVHGLLVMPTETFYGVAACARDRAALQRLVQLKARPALAPLPLIAAHVDDVLREFDCGPWEQWLMQQAWPGPLTLCLAPKHPEAWPSPVLSARGLIGVRVSSHGMARAVAQAAGGFVTATSANLRGAASPQTVAAIQPEVRRACAVVIDAGELPGGAPSSVVECVENSYRVLRPGAVPPEQLARWHAQWLEMQHA